MSTSKEPSPSGRQAGGQQCAICGDPIHCQDSYAIIKTEHVRMADVEILTKHYAHGRCERDVFGENAG